MLACLPRGRQREKKKWFLKSMPKVVFGHSTSAKDLTFFSSIAIFILNREDGKERRK